MVFISSASRFSSLTVSVILTQTDTTVGFLSHDEQKLCEIKSRQNSKSFIKVFKNFKTLKESKYRIPNTFKNEVRRSKKITYIIKGKAFRVAKSSLDSQLLRDLKWSFSTSANETGKNFNREFCEHKADIIIENNEGLNERFSSNLYKLNLIKKRKLR